MRSIGASVGPSAAVSQIALFPNGIRHAGGGDTDVWLGSCLVKEVRILGAAALAGTMTFFDGLVDATGVVVTGGTGAATDRHRVIVASANLTGTIGGLVDPVYANTGASTLNAEVTGLRKVRTALGFTIAAGVPYQMPMELAFPIGCVILVEFNSSTGVFNVEADFEPWVSGAFRKRQKTNFSAFTTVPI